VAKSKHADAAPEAETAAAPAEMPAESVTGTDHVRASEPLPEPPVPAPGRARILPFVAAGALTAALGAGGAYYVAREFPEALRLAGTPGLEQRLSDHDQRLSDLAAALADRPAADVNIGAIEAALAELQSGRAALTDAAATIESLSGQVADLEKRLKALESRPFAAGTAPAADLAAAEAAAAAAKQAEAEAARLKTEAEVAARLSAARAALGAIRAAFESGAAYEADLAALTDAGLAVPEALAQQAQGIPTLAALRDSFPDAARDALAISLGEAAGGDTWDRVAAFLRSQTGARSLTPRAGDDPDAVLSRAEAAVAAGDLPAALAEIEALPDGGRVRLAEWTALAERRLAAAGAIAAIGEELK
jgi:hypothetical protein